MVWGGEKCIQRLMLHHHLFQVYTQKFMALSLTLEIRDPSPAGQPSDIFFHLVPSVPIYVGHTPMATRLSFFSAEKYESMGGQGLSARKYLGS